MKAIVWTDYGSPDVLRLREVEQPAPEDNEVLIRVCATTATAGDCEMRSLTGAFWFALVMRVYAGLKTPTRITILGMELAGEIESVGKDVERFKEGDLVFGATGFADMGAYAEYICLPEAHERGALAIKPANMTFEEAAPVPVGGIEALHFLRQGNIQSGQRILINGAGGTIGPYAVQLAKHFGLEVTAVDSTERMGMLRSIGADYITDYTQEDFTQSGQTYDFILDVVSKGSFSGCIRSLKQNGRYLIANPGLAQMIRGRWTSMRSRLFSGQSGKRVLFGSAHPNIEDLDFLKELIEAGKLESVIDRCYPLEQTAEAHRYVEQGGKTGNVIITVRDSGMA